MRTYKNKPKRTISILATCAQVKHQDVCVPVAEGRYEVEAAVNSVVLDVSSVQAALISEVLFKLLVDVVLYLLPADANTKTLSE